MNWKDKVSSAEVLQKLLSFSNLIHSWNPRINLTGFKTIPEIEELLIGESVLALNALRPGSESILDFGSGAGIPGLVWAICNRELKVTSLEIREKKIAFQKEAQRTLRFSAEILRGHFPEDVASRRFDIIVSRAIRLEEKVWEQSTLPLAPDGRIVRF